MNRYRHFFTHLDETVYLMALSGLFNDIQAEKSSAVDDGHSLD